MQFPLSQLFDVIVYLYMWIFVLMQHVHKTFNVDIFVKICDFLKKKIMIVPSWVFEIVSFDTQKFIFNNFNRWLLYTSSSTM